MFDKRNFLVAVLTLSALALMIAAYFAPIWWVSLTAPNYPPEAFPDGIRIHFHFDRVANGCTAAAQGTRMADELIQKDLSGDDERYNPITDAGRNLDQGAQGLDCVHEMNTINHYVGMFPIETGAPVERPLAKFFFGFFAVMLLAFALPKPKGRVLVLSVGFLVLFAWIVVDQFVLGHLEQQVQHYMLETGSFFKEPERIQAWGNTVLYASVTVIVGLVLAMIIVVLGTLKIRSFQLLLAFVPALLPLFFVVTYAGWLWFFGHNLHPWGAFTVKPFMPTVFGEGKVAQFSTFSYPTWGFALLVLVFVCLMLAVLIRRKQLQEDAKP
ncbi:MAG: hypothetical protein LBJ59_06040 [Zoogloeaceae bacterium]|nr:hypothetical protein [Zoogloeaceae bacterium]